MSLPARTEAAPAPAEPAPAGAAKRVLVLSHHERDFPGGASIADRALAAELARLGHEVDLLFYGDLLPAGVRGTWRQLLFPWAAALAFLRRRRRAYDVVESTAGDAWVIGLLLPLLARRPLLSIRTHGLEHRRARLDREERRRAGRPPSWTTRLYHYRYRLAEVARDLRRADAAFFLNEADRDFAVGALGVAAGRAHAVPNGIDPELLAAGAWRGGGTVFDVLFLGRWVAAKGADLVPRIARRAFAADARFRLTCAGVDVPEERVLADFDPADRGRVRVVRHYGRDELPRLLAGHGVLLAPSRAEGCSLALLEGMAGGLVPLASRTGYAADLLRHGENGFLLDPGDAEGFARALLALAADPRAEDIGRAARRSAEAHSWQDVAARRVEIWSRAATLPESGR